MSDSCCSVLQCVAVCLNRRMCKSLRTLSTSLPDARRIGIRCCVFVLQCIAVCCSALQCAAVRCSALQFCISKQYIGTYSLDEPVIRKANWYWAKMFGSIHIWQYVVVSCSVLQLLAPGTVSVLAWIYLSVCVGYLRIYVRVCVCVRLCACACVRVYVCA